MAVDSWLKCGLIGLRNIPNNLNNDSLDASEQRKTFHHQNRIFFIHWNYSNKFNPNLHFVITIKIDLHNNVWFES